MVKLDKMDQTKEKKHTDDKKKVTVIVDNEDESPPNMIEKGIEDKIFSAIQVTGSMERSGLESIG